MNENQGTKRGREDGLCHVLVAADVHEQLREIGFKERRSIADVATELLRAGLVRRAKRAKQAVA